MKLKKIVIYLLYLIVLSSIVLGVRLVRETSTIDVNNVLNNTYSNFSSVPKSTVSIVIYDFDANTSVIEDNDTNIYNSNTQVYNYYWDDDIEIKVPYNTLCTANASENFRRCSLIAEVNYKSKTAKDLLVNEWKADFTTTKSTDEKVKIDESLISTKIGANEKLITGKHNISFEFKYPSSAGEKYNITIAGIEIDPEIDACTTFVAAGTYLLNTNLVDSSTADCMNFQSSDVILDCQGNTVDGNDAADKAVLILSTANNVTIKNCIFNDWDAFTFLVNSDSGDTQDLIYIENVTITDSKDKAIQLQNVHNASITNTIITDVGSNNYGIWLNTADYVLVQNVSISAPAYNEKGFYLTNSDFVELINVTTQGGMWDIEMLANGIDDCFLTFENVTGSNSLPLAYFDASYKDTIVRDYNNNFSQLLTCGADNLTIINFTYDGGASEERGAYFVASDNVTVLDSSFTRGQSLIYTWSSSNLVINNSDISFSDLDAISLSTGTNGFNITNCNLYNNDGDFITAKGNDNVLIANNYFYNFQSQHFIDVSISSSENYVIYNNIFECNGCDAIDFYDAASGSLNTSNQVGTRILGSGTNISGNAWLNTADSGTDYYYTCADSNCDGFCDAAYDDPNDGSDDSDYNALSDEWIDGGCASDSCTCPVSGNWELDWTDNCLINTDCSITNGLGNITVINTDSGGSLGFNATISLCRFNQSSIESDDTVDVYPYMYINQSVC